MMQNTWRSVWSSFAAAPSPAATESPCPSDPVAASKNGKPIAGLGWPSRTLSAARRVSASSNRSTDGLFGVPTTPPRSQYAA